MNKQIVLKFGYTKKLDIAAALITLGYDVHPEMGINRDENGFAHFYFKMENTNPDIKLTSSKVIQIMEKGADFNDFKTNWIHPVALINEYIANRNALLDFVKKSKPISIIRQGKYTILTNVSDNNEILEGIDALSLGE